MIVAAADGSALGNPGPAGWCWYIDDDRWAAGGWPHGTNNMGELMALLDLLHATAGSDEQLLVFCDSTYVINAVTKWMPNWKRKGWKKADGKPVLNQALLRDLDNALAGRNVELEWVKGHSGHALNEAADLRARAVATAYQQQEKPETGPGFGSGAERTPAESRLAIVGAEVTEPTLFDDPPSDVEQVVAAERELRTLAAGTDAAGVAALLAPGWTQIRPTGQLQTRSQLIATGQSAPDPTVTFELLDSTPLAADVLLILWRTMTAEESVLGSSIWQRSGQQWRQVFTQATAES